MSTTDPFSAFETERTIIKPSAGRGARTGMPPAASAAPEVVPLLEMASAAGMGVLLQLSSSLLMMASRMRSTLHHPDPRSLLASLVNAVAKFERDARARGIPNEHVIGARYVLCTYIDECASSTPWGGSGAWAAHSLLVHFHNEAWGGEKVFQLLGMLVGNVQANRGLLELIYTVICLGFEGRYRAVPNGRMELEGVREALALKLREQGTSAPRELSPSWVGAPASARRLRDGVPVWVAATGAAVLLAGTFVGLRFAMADRTDPVFAQLHRLDIRTPAAPLAVPAPAAPQVMQRAPAASVVPRLSTLLKPEIDAGLVEVRDLADRSIVTIKGDGFFKAGSAEVEPRVLPLMQRIGDELARLDGQVVVSGHTDAQPIRSVRFPSNWDLSEARARAVKGLLATRLKPERIRSEGMADTQPVADNATPAGRARNRRVDITLRLT